MNEGQEKQKSLFARIVDQLTDPANIRSSIMVLGLVAIAGVLFGIFFDGGRFLLLLKDSEVSRGLITFLVALTTVLLAIILAIYAITAQKDEAVKERFSHGKEILTMLVGILGTVLGFYFGTADKSTSNIPTLASVRFEGQKLLTHASGGTTPYRYSITSSNQSFAKIDGRITKDGWIAETLDKMPSPNSSVTVSIFDAKDKAVSVTVPFIESIASQPKTSDNTAANPQTPLSTTDQHK
jgi:hypothetical protein